MNFLYKLLRIIILSPLYIFLFPLIFLITLISTNNLEDFIFCMKDGMRQFKIIERR